MTSMTTRIDAGAAWLDHHHPAWSVLIDADELDMASANACILGQLYAEHPDRQGGETGYITALRLHTPGGPFTDEATRFAVAHGFDNDEAEGRNELTVAWRERLVEA